VPLTFVEGERYGVSRETVTDLETVLVLVLIVIMAEVR
jgi:hypothetical protein